MKPLLVVLLLALVAAPIPPAEAQSVAPIFKRVNPSVVIIRARWKEVGGSGQVGRVDEVGSGVLISSDGRVITAAHVVQTADEITAEFLGSETYDALQARLRSLPAGSIITVVVLGEGRPVTLRAAKD